MQNVKFPKLTRVHNVTRLPVFEFTRVQNVYNVTRYPFSKLTKVQLVHIVLFPKLIGCKMLNILSLLGCTMYTI